MSVANYYRQWLAKFPKEPLDRMAVALKAVDAFEACEKKQPLSDTDLEPVRLAASSPYRLIHGVGCALLMELASVRKEAQQCLMKLGSSNDGKVRLQVMQHLDWKVPEAIRMELVNLGLRDRSPRVRTFAIQQAEMFLFRSLLPTLIEMQSVETNEGVRSSLQFNIPLLKQGYFLERCEDGTGYSLVVRTRKAVGGHYIPNAKATPEFIEDEVKRILEKDGPPGPP